MGQCFSCSTYQLEHFVAGAANQAIEKNFGVDVLGKVNEVRYSAADVGLHMYDPIHVVDNQVDDLVNKIYRGPNGEHYKVKNTSTEKLVTSVEEFIALRDKVAKAPSGGVVCLVHALINFLNRETRSVGEQLLVLAAAEDQLIKGSTYKGYALGEDMAAFVADLIATEDDEVTAKAAISSLVVGTKQQESHTYDVKKIALGEDLTSSEGEDAKTGVFSVYLRSTGSEHSRAVTMAVNKNGVWKARDFTGLFSSVEAAPITLTAADDL